MRLIAASIGITTFMVCALAVTAEAHADTPTPCNPAGVTFGMSGYPDGTGVHVPAGMVPVAYPAGIFPWDPVSYDEGAAIGRDNMVNTVNDYASRCDGPIHVYGHSYGARTAGDALLVLDAGPHAHRITGTLTGDPRHHDGDTRGIEGTLHGMSIAGITMTGPREPTTNIVVDSHCNPRDLICDFPPLNEPLKIIDHAFGYLSDAHVYPVGA